MCGINGFNFEDREIVESMNTKTAHRGPDDTGFLCSNGWSLGNNRLAIIDLSSAGHQPMRSKSGRYSIVYNGELYNYRAIKKELEALGHSCVSATDTEVILIAYEQWGKNSVKKFNGMFSFAILDHQNGELFLARDHLGIKPLYYYYKNGVFIFSSEAKGIFVHKNISVEMDMEAFNIFMRILYVPAPLTIWKDIYKLQPGHYAYVKNGALVIERYWQFVDEPVIPDREYIKNEIQRLIKDSISLQLVSDRPVGVFLSGGIDSTIIAGVANQLSPHIKTFSVGYEATEEALKYNNDMMIARQTAKFFGTSHHEYVLSPKDIVTHLQTAIHHMDEPISNHIQAVNLLLSRAVSGEATVVLGGDGGDELFGGYERYYYSHLLESLDGFPRKMHIPHALAMATSLFGRINLSGALRANAGAERYLSFFSQNERLINAVINPGVSDESITRKWFTKLYFPNAPYVDFTRQFMRTDIASWLPSESLVRSDKMSMAAQIEGRFPLLDIRLVELADRIPVSYKIGKKGLNMISRGRHYTGKVILREAMVTYIPSFVANQPKWGWFSPAAKWIRGPLLPMMREVLSPEFNIGTAQLFNFKELNRVLDKHVSKETYSLNMLWAVLTFQLWYRQFMHK